MNEEAYRWKCPQCSSPMDPGKVRGKPAYWAKCACGYCAPEKSIRQHWEGQRTIAALEWLGQEVCVRSVEAYRHQSGEVRAACRVSVPGGGKGMIFGGDTPLSAIEAARNSGVGMGGWR